MKSIIKILCGLSILGLATVACNKEVETETPVANKHSVKVTAGISAETRTEMLPSGNQTKWTEEDVSNIHFFENGIEPAEGDLVVDLNDEKTVMTLMADFPTPSVTPSKYVYTSILASDLDENKNAILDDEQIFFNGTFDPTADILVAKPEEFPANQNEVVFSMQYKRVVAVNKIKIKGLEADDNIISVTINANKPILGSYSMTNDAWTNSGYQLVLYPYNDLEVSSEGEVSIYFITAPVENALLSIYVETENHNYEKDFTKTISFAANTVTSFATTVANSEVEVNTGTNDFIRIESTNDLEEGEYVLVTEGSAKIFTGFSTTSTVYGIGVDVTIDATNHKISKNDVNTGYVLSLAPATKTEGAWVIKQGNSFFNWSSGNSLNSTSEESASSNWLISISEGNAAITNAANESRQIWWNVSSPRFACYTGKTDGDSYKITQLYKKDLGGATKSPLAKPVVTLARNSSLDGIVVTWADVNKAGSYTVTCTGQTDKTIDQGVQTAEFTNLNPGTYTVTVTANPANPDRNTPTTSDEESLEILNYQLTAPTVSFSGNTTTSIVATWNKQDLDDEKAASYSYQILDGETVVVGETTVTTNGFTEEGLTSNHTYTVKFKVNGKAPYVGTEYTSYTTKTLKESLKTIAEIKSEIVAGVKTYEAELTNAIVTGLYSTGAFIQDNTAGIYVYGATTVSGLTLGKSFTGKISGNMQYYNNLQPEITSITFDEGVTWSDAVLPLEQVSLADLTANMSSYDGKRVKITKVKTAGTLATAANSTVKVSYGTSDITVITRVERSSSIAADTYIDVIGFPFVTNNSNSPNRIAVTDASAIVESPITWQVKSIDVATVPTKLNYTAGESFDPTGLVISTVVEDADDPSIYKNGGNVSYAGHESEFSFDPALDDELTVSDTSVEITYGGKSVSQNISVYAQGEVPVYATKTIDFENALSSYSDWTFNNIGTDNDAITAHGGSKYGANINDSGNGVASASISTVATYAKPYDVKFYISKCSNNSSTSSWIVQVSSDGSTWTDVESIDAKGMSKGVWQEKTVSLTAYSNVYVRVLYSGSTAIRAIDDIEIKYQTN